MSAFFSAASLVLLMVAQASSLCLSMQSKYMGAKPVFVAGGSRGVGLEVVKLLSAAGTPVHALVRRIDAVAELSKYNGVKCFLGDAFDEAAVQASMNGCVAAITTLGGKPEADGKRVDYFGNSNVVEQAGILGCERIILVTSVGCGDTKGAVSESVYKVLEEAILAKNKAERDLRTYTNLDWTIIRPGGLKSEPSTGKAIFTEDRMASGVINREDVARLIIDALKSDGRATRRELTAIDPSQASAHNGGSATPFPV